MNSLVGFTNGIDKMMELFGFSKVVCEHKPASKHITVLVFQADLKFSIFLLMVQVEVETGRKD